MSKAKPPAPAPTFLTTAGKRRFTALAKTLPPLTPEQRNLLGLYCQAWENWTRHQTEIAKHGSVIESGTRLFCNPAIASADTAEKSIIKLGKIFGFTPSGIEAQEAEPTSPLKGLIDDE